MRLAESLRVKLVGWAERVMQRQPDFVVSNDTGVYLQRWFVVPRNPLFNVYLHRFLGSDDDRALHDHPWASLSVFLSGWYLEFTSSGVRRRVAGDLVLRGPWTAHRIALPLGAPAVTLFLTGPRVRTWGFHCPQGWRPWRDFVRPGAHGERGRGCE